MDLEGLIRALVAADGMLWVIGGGDIVSENMGRNIREPTFHGGYAAVEAESWHFHLKMDSVASVQFVEAEDHGIPYLYYVRLASAKEETVLRCYFPNPYLDDNEQPTEFQPERFRYFEEFRDRWVGQDAITFVRRPRQAAA